MTGMETASCSAEAFGELVRLYENKVYTLALRMCANPEDARDVAQEAFLSAWKGLPSFRGEAGLAPRRQVLKFLTASHVRPSLSLVPLYV